MIKETKDGLILQLKILPNSSKNGIVISEDGAVKIKVTAQPIDGKANKALIDFLSKELKIPKTSIEIIKGALNKEKTVLFHVFDSEKITLIKKNFENIS